MLLLGFLFVVQFPVVQKQMANEFCSWIAKEYEIDLQSDKIKLGLFSGLQWDDVLLLDSKQDTLLYVEEIKIKASNLGFNHFSKVYLEGIELNYSYTDSVTDAEFYKYIAPFLTSKKESNPLFIDNLWINGGRIDFGNSVNQYSFRDIDLYLKDCDLSSESSFVLSNLAWKQFEGQEHKLEANQIEISNGARNVEGFLWRSGESVAEFDFSQFNDSTELQVHQLKVDKNAVNGILNQWPTDLAFDLSASFNGVGDRLWAENIKIQSTNGSKVNGDFIVQKYSDFSNLTYSINADEFNIDSKEWLWIEPLFEQNYLLSKLGSIRSNATINGSLSDINLNLLLSSDQGNIESELFVNISDSLDAPVYKGDLMLSQFNLAPFVQNDALGNIEAEVSVEGKGFDLLSFDTEVYGQISTLVINDYNYSNISLDGRLQPNHFKGKAIVKDENLEVDFSGEVDFSKNKPVMDFVADVVEANLVQLNWYNKSSVAKLSSLVEMNFKGSRWDDIEGDIGVYYTTVETYDNYYHFNDIFFSSEKLADKDVLKLSSDFGNANFEGKIDVPNLFQSFTAYLNPHFPLLNKGRDKSQNFVFNINLFNSSALTNFLVPQLKLGDGAVISGSFNNRAEGLSLQVNSPNLGWDKWLCRDLRLTSIATTEHWELALSGEKLDYNNATKIENIEIDQVGNYGDWRYAMAWTSNDTIKYDGIVKGMAKVNSNELNLFAEESQFYFADSLWVVDESSEISYRNKKLNASILLNTALQNIAVSFEGDKVDKQVDVQLQNFDFENVSPWLNRAKTDVKGLLSGNVSWSNFNEVSQVNSQLSTNHLYLNNFLFGALDLNVDFDEESEVHNIVGVISKYGEPSVEIDGACLAQLDSNNFTLGVEVLDFDMRHLRSYLDVVVTNVDGEGNGSLNFYGALKSPKFDGEFTVDNIALNVPYLNTFFKAQDQSVIQLSDRHIEFKDFDFVSVEDRSEVGVGNLKGDILHSYFTDFALDLELNADSLLCLNTDEYRDEAYFGTAIASGDATFKGPINAIEIVLNAQSKKGTSLSIPLDDEDVIDERSFVHFVDEHKVQSDTIWTIAEQLKKNTGVTVDLNLELDETAQTHIIFDETLGDKLSCKGKGFINVGVNNADEVYMFGDYTVSEGDYLFTLQNFVNKKFKIQPGAKLLWDGEPYNAKMDLNALYIVNTSMSNLSPEYTRNSEVECTMKMTGDLIQPNIDFDIQIPNGDDYIKRLLEERTNTQEKETQQFLSLLVLNSFMSADELANTDVDYLSSTLSTGTEVLSNQLSNWMSQFTDRVDLGLKYQPNQGDTLSNKEFELLLNNMKVNDKITFNGNIGTLPAQNKTRFIGDFKVEYRLSDDGKLRLLAFRNLEESFQLQNDESNYTTGLGLFYRDEFDDFTDLWNKFKGMFKRK